MKKILILVILLQAIFAYTNPVQQVHDSPDPGVIYFQESYYAVTTGGWDNHAFPIWNSKTGTNFTQVGWGLLNAPAWTVCCDYWAPEIHIISGKFLLYYTARDKAGKLSIGAASASNILGPYIDKGSPLVTNASEGVIDATVLTTKTENKKYIVYKVDGNAHGHQTEFWALFLSPTGLNTVGEPVSLLKNDQAWEKGII
jgi:GH43 family beta-xylosidase